jgi:hypothetical protein
LCVAMAPTNTHNWALLPRPLANKSQAKNKTLCSEERPTYQQDNRAIATLQTRLAFYPAEFPQTHLSHSASRTTTLHASLASGRGTRLPILSYCSQLLKFISTLWKKLVVKWQMLKKPIQTQH